MQTKIKTVVKIDNIELPDFPLLLAPMEDVSDPPFRALCKEQGADVVKKKYLTVSGLDVFQYSYTYGNTYFAYFAVENNNVYYLVGFVDHIYPEEEIYQKIFRLNAFELQIKQGRLI